MESNSKAAPGWQWCKMIQVLKKPTKKESTHVFIKYQASVILKASRFREKFNLMVSGEDFCSAWTGESAVGWAQDIHTGWFF